MPLKIIKRPSVIEGGSPDKIVDMLAKQISKHIPKNRTVVVDCSVHDNKQFIIKIDVIDLEGKMLESQDWLPR